MIRWGILGTGKVANKFANSLKFVENAKLMAVGSRTSDTARQFAQQFNAPFAFGSYEELAAFNDIDIVYIATPHIYHFSNTMLCLNHNKAVLCEKPFAMDANEVEQMIGKAKEKNLFLMEALWTRFFPSFLKVQELINTGSIGKIVHLRADFGFKAPYLLESRLFNKLLGGGALLDIGIYPVFLAYTLLGYPDEITTSAIIGSTGVDESMAINFTYRSGAIASLFCTLMADTNIEAEIFGTQGYIKIYRRWHHANEITIGNFNGYSETFQFSTPSYGYECEAQEVTNCLLAGKKESDLLSLKNSLQLMKLLDTIREMNKISYK